MDSANAASAVSRNKGSSLLPRVLSALALIPVVIGVVWWSYWAVVAVVVAASGLAALELYNAYSHGGFHPHRWLGITGTIALVLAVALAPLQLPVSLPQIVLTSITIITLVASLLRSTHHDNELTNWALTLSGVVYLGWLTSFMILVRGLDTPLSASPLSSLGIESGAAWLYSVLAITWLQDTFAYFAGRTWGRHQLAPALSPKKTWEGAVGGLIGAVFAAMLAVFLLGLPISYGAAVLLGLAGGVAGPLGDLAESMVKRQVGIKDAGHIIPGHGGLLDRMDSLLFTVPVLFYLILLLIS